MFWRTLKGLIHGFYLPRPLGMIPQTRVGIITILDVLAVLAHPAVFTFRPLPQIIPRLVLVTGFEKHHPARGRTRRPGGLWKTESGR